MKEWVTRENVEVAIDLWHRFKGRPMVRWAGFLLVVAASLEWNALQIIVTAIAAMAGLKLSLPDTPHFVPITFAISATILLITDQLFPRLFRPSSSVHDIALLKQYRELIGIRLVRFLGNHHFRHAFHRKLIEPLEILSDEWTTAHHEFDNRDVQAKLTRVRDEVRTFNNLADRRLFMDDRNSNLLTTNPDRAYVTAFEGRAQTEELNTAARKVAAEFNEFERLARQKIA